MHTDRLLKLADLLERDAKNPAGLKFDLGTWAAPSKDFEKYRVVAFSADFLGLEDDSEPAYRTDVPVSPDKLPKVACGTTACALGLAMLSGEFAEWGLGGSATIDSGSVQLHPSCNGEDGFDAGAELFGISSHDSEYLFDPASYENTPQEAEGELFVAQRIRDFAAGHIEAHHHPETRDEYGD